MSNIKIGVGRKFRKDGKTYMIGGMARHFVSDEQIVIFAAVEQDCIISPETKWLSRDAFETFVKNAEEVLM